MIEIPFVVLSIRHLQLAPLNSMSWLRRATLDLRLSTPADRRLRMSRSIRPEKVIVELLGSDEVFELFQTGKRPVFKDLFRHVNPLEQTIELFRSASRVPSASGLVMASMSKRRRGAPAADRMIRLANWSRHVSPLKPRPRPLRRNGRYVMELV
jgi:hypothetical protein